MKRLLTFLAVAAVSAVCAQAQLNPPPNAPMYFAGLTAPDLTDANEVGKNVSLSQMSGYGGEFIVVDFAAVWCAPCNQEAHYGNLAAAAAAVTDNYATQYLTYRGATETVGVGSNVVQLLVDGHTPGTAATAKDVLHWTTQYSLPYTVLYPPTTQDYDVAGFQLYLYGNASSFYISEPEAGGFYPLKVVLGPDMKILGYPNSASYDPADPYSENQITTLIQNAFDTNDTYKLYDLIAFTHKSGVPISPGDHVYGASVGRPLKDALDDSLEIQKTDDFVTQRSRTRNLCDHLASFVDGAELGPASTVLLSTPLALGTVLGKALDIQVDMGCVASPFTFQPAAHRRSGVAKSPLEQ